MNQSISVDRIARNGAWYVAQARLNAMSKWKGIITFVAIGNPLFYLVAIGIGVGVLVSQNSGTSGTGGVKYILFIAPALLANTALLGAMDEVVFPIMEGFKWRKLFYATNATPITGGQISLGVFIAALIRTAYSVTIYWILLVIFRVVDLGSWPSVLVAMYGGAAFGALLMAIVAGVVKDDYFLTVLGRLVITPLFLFSGTFFPLSSMPVFLQPIGWISPLWHTTELGRYFAYGQPISITMLIIHFAFLSALLVGGLSVAEKRFTTRLLK